jgi:hypothetical protein
MDLEELERLRNLNELDLLHKIVEISQESYDAAEEAIKQQRGWKYRGVTLRDKMQDVKLIAEIIRDKIQLRKGVEWGPKRKFALDKAIEEEVERLKKQEEKTQKRRRGQIARNE